MTFVHWIIQMNTCDIFPSQINVMCLAPMCSSNWNVSGIKLPKYNGSICSRSNSPILIWAKHSHAHKDVMSSGSLILGLWWKTLKDDLVINPDVHWLMQEALKFQAILFISDKEWLTTFWKHIGYVSINLTIDLPLINKSLWEM